MSSKDELSCEVELEGLTLRFTLGDLVLYSSVRPWVSIPAYSHSFVLPTPCCAGIPVRRWRSELGLTYSTSTDSYCRSCEGPIPNFNEYVLTEHQGREATESLLIEAGVQPLVAFMESESVLALLTAKTVEIMEFLAHFSHDIMALRDVRKIISEKWRREANEEASPYTSCPLRHPVEKWPKGSFSPLSCEPLRLPPSTLARFLLEPLRAPLKF